MRQIDTYDDAHAAIWDRSGWDRGYISNPFAGDDAARLGLERTRLVLEALGRPDRQFQIVHVAGSKGKGSTCVMLDGILRAAGYRSGRFLSPHLHTMRERFVVDDRMIDEASFVSIVRRVMAASDSVEAEHPQIGTLTAWEISTAMTLLWFADVTCDVAVIEVGLGGTLDATNVVTPSCSVITRLDFEHTAILGDTMTEIASNKAGIIKPGVPCVTVNQPEEGLAVIRDRAASQGSDLQIAGRDWTVSGSTANFAVEGPEWSHRHLELAMAGAHQLENAGLAIAAIELVSRNPSTGIAPGDDAIRAGLASAMLAGRFEVVTAPDGSIVVLDGAHTPESMAALTATIGERFPGREVVAVVGMLEGRRPGDVVPPLARIASHLIVTQPANPRAMASRDIAIGLAGIDVSVEFAADVASAQTAALLVAKSRNAILLVTGSFSTVAEFRDLLGVAGPGQPATGVS